MIALPILIITLIVQLAIGSLVGAVILRGASALFNKWFGGAGVAAVDQTALQPAANSPRKSAQSDSPYAPPMAPLKQSKGYLTKRLPEPDFGKAFLICLVALLVNVAVGVVCGFAVGMAFPGEPAGIGFIALQIGVLGFGFLVLAVGIKIGFPTSFPRSLAVAGLFLVVGLIVAVAIGVGVGLIVSVI